MTIQYELAREGRVLWQTFTDPLDMVEVSAHIDQIKSEVLDHATKTVHTVSDFLQVTKLPSNVLSGSLSILRNSHPMSGELILIANNRFVNTAANILKRTALHYKINICKTKEEGWEIVDTILEKEKATVDK